ncbi:MAG: hypothetical protein KH900_03635 [[Clostridium] symbiosum]|uniref:hypothetical protein n=2 Tax=Clostridia TaxID=186801 RepID=UPI0011AF02B1|nr:hypothetical protein [Clostridium sp. chh4-2]MBS6219521.1 hypothetical protein [[Clostridium] symbiosum]
MEQPKTLKSLINISFNLDQYELLTDICDSGEIARELLSRDKGIHIPMEIADMLDYSRIKDAYFTHHQGEFCPSGLVLKKDSAVIEEIYQDDRQPGFEKDCLFLVHLYSKENGTNVQIAMPAPQERLDHARAVLQTEDINQCQIWEEGGVQGDLWNYLPIGETLERINQAAFFLKESILDGNDQITLLKAALEAEGPRDMDSVIKIIRDLDQYELCVLDPENPDEFVQQLLFNSDYYEIDNFIIQFVDMEKLIKALLEREEAVETENYFVLCKEWKFCNNSKELSTLRLFYPLEGMMYERNQAGEWKENPVPVYGAELSNYSEAIQNLLNAKDWSMKRGFAEYLSNKLLRHRIASMLPSVELYGGSLYGVAEIQYRGELQPAEVDYLINAWEAYTADGWGDAFHETMIQIGERGLALSFFQESEEFYILPEGEFKKRLSQQNTMQMSGMQAI